MLFDLIVLLFASGRISKVDRAPSVSVIEDWCEYA